MAAWPNATEREEIKKDLLPGEFVPNGMHIVGRGKLFARAQAHRKGRNITIRIEDSLRPDFWAEIRLTPAALREMLDPPPAVDPSE